MPLTKEYLAQKRSEGQVRNLTRLAMLDGTLVKQPCEMCGTTERVQAHHADYGKPLEVQWLCHSHHRQHHIALLYAAAARREPGTCASCHHWGDSNSTGRAWRKCSNRRGPSRNHIVTPSYACPKWTAA